MTPKLMLSKVLKMFFISSISTLLLVSLCAIWLPPEVISWEVCSIFAVSGISNGATAEYRPIVSTIQSANCVRVTRLTPIILPNISCIGLTDETMTSTMRLVFSSITPRITALPDMKIVM